jgi:pimeloyl-ACP methyl ester carboxylesterase
VAFESPLLLSSSSPPTSVGDGATVVTPGVATKKNKCILVGGLSDGLLPLPYTQALERVCDENGWSLVQPILSSSYTGFGHSSLDKDVQELEELLEYLIIHRKGERFCLVGHSTGCLDAVHFLKKAADRYVSRLALVVLQAPVSDREHAAMMTTHGEPSSEYVENLAIAQQLRDQGKADEMMPRKCFWAPITAQRFLDLQERGGADDYFSSDYTDDELSERLQHVGVRALSTSSSSSSISGSSSRLRVLVAYSGLDEYVPSHVDKRKLTDRIVKAMNGGGGDNAMADNVATPLYIADGIHNLQQGPGASDVLIQKIDEIFKSLN